PGTERRDLLMKRQTQTKKQVWRALTATTIALSLVAGILIGESAKAESIKAPRAQTALAKYASDLTAAAEQGKFNSIDEKTAETDQAIQILSGEHKNNPVVISDSQAVRDIVAVSVARRIARGEVPAALSGKRFFKLNLDTLFHDSKDAQQLNSHLSQILSDIAQLDNNAILLIDPIQALVGPEGAFEGAASALLREAIKSGTVQCFGASSQVAFQKNVASEESLAPLFAAIEADQTFGADTESGQSAKAERINKESFVGDNVSPDLRELMRNNNAPSHVKAILQVNDVNNPKVRELLSANGVAIDAQMPQLGSLAVDVPTKVIDKLAASSQTNYLSLDRKVAAAGHIENTIGETAMWAQG